MNGQDCLDPRGSDWRRFGWASAVVIAMGLLLQSGCSEEKAKTPQPGSSPTPPTKPSSALPPGPGPTLLVSQAQFVRKPDGAGKGRPVPGPARLLLLRKTPAGWQSGKIEDPDSNVFHKAMVCDLDGKGPAILTIGAMRAALKVWRRSGDGWTHETLWQPTFGGKWDRLRDVEIGDVTGDGQPEIVVATHDQGVIGVLRKEATGWKATELDREPSTFVHEIEIGDIDGDGLNEFFATRSEPNRATLVSQPGQVVMYKWNGTTFDRTVLDEPEGTHAKEILAVKLGDSAATTLFAVIEARTEARGKSSAVVEPVRIKSYRFEQGKLVSQEVATLDDRQCRFLSPGDVDGDGKLDIVAAGMNSGLWILRQQADGSWASSCIEEKSGGFEHATLVADLEGNGQLEIFVNADRQKEIRRYRWHGDHFEKELIVKLSDDEMTFNLAAGRF